MRGPCKSKADCSQRALRKRRVGIPASGQLWSSCIRFQINKSGLGGCMCCEMSTSRVCEWISGIGVIPRAHVCAVSVVKEAPYGSSSSDTLQNASTDISLHHACAHIHECFSCLASVNACHAFHAQFIFPDALSLLLSSGQSRRQGLLDAVRWSILSIVPEAW
jgi:hypothetical protein